MRAEFRWGERTYVMGICNLSPDSFSGDGLGNDIEAVVAQARRFVAEGADIIDIGGESTRPGTEPVSPDSADKDLQLVDTDIYAVIRHPQYLGGILAIFVATPLLYPHWLFLILGIPGVAILYWSTIEEEKQLIERFGDYYSSYMRRMPRMNLTLGIIRFWRNSRRR